jgi:hypothetical protein
MSCIGRDSSVDALSFTFPSFLTFISCVCVCVCSPARFGVDAFRQRCVASEKEEREMAAPSTHTCGQKEEELQGWSREQLQAAEWSVTMITPRVLCVRLPVTVGLECLLCRWQ